jgi:SAM-dependent methyltransferase
MAADRAALTAHVAKNRAHWERESDAYQERHGPQLAEKEGLAWGVWQVPEAELNVLGDVSGLDVLELGCGAAQWSISLAELGARPVGLDVSPRQLEHARRAQTEKGMEFPLVEASAEDVPLVDDGFDLIFCDHGAFNFADPRILMPECARLLRDDGLLAFNTISPILDLFYDVEADRITEQACNDYFTLDRFEDDETVDFQMPYGDWVRLFRDNGFVVEDLIEIQPREGATTTYELVPYEWARRWPAENIWKARKPG